MREIRLFHSGKISQGELVVLDVEAHSHISRVLRLKSGAAVTLINGDGFNYYGSIAETSKKESSVLIDRLEKNERAPNSPLILLIALLKGTPMDYVLQKSVELGVTHIYPLQTSRSERQIDSKKWQKKRQHWRGILISSALQCGRAEFPALEAPQPLEAVLDQFDDMHKWMLSPHHASAEDQSLRQDEGLALMVGPEGGFTEKEVAAAVQNNWQPKLFGSRILRADTAAIVGLTCAQVSLANFKLTY